jgi:TetR/AcrR family transcriptional regulator, transcriptional repressor for nem operon
VDDDLAGRQVDHPVDGHPGSRADARLVHEVEPLARLGHLHHEGRGVGVSSGAAQDDDVVVLPTLRHHLDQHSFQQLHRRTVVPVGSDHPVELLPGDADAVDLRVALEGLRAHAGHPPRDVRQCARPATHPRQLLTDRSSMYEDGAVARPRGFDEAVVVDAAARCFTDLGYAATSVDDLVGATGLHRGSLYGAFGSKRGLFLAALARHAPTCDGGSEDDDERALDILLVAALELAPHDDEVRDLVRDACGALGPAAATVLGRRLLGRARLEDDLPEADAAPVVPTGPTPTTPATRRA